MYPADWHTLYGNKTGNSAKAILPDLIAAFEVKSLIEIGCGNGHWTQAAVDSGVGDYNVVDGPWNNRDHLLVDRSRFIETNLSTAFSPGRRYDMAICLEVAEHVQTASADQVVETLTGCADVILFGAAIPLQDGYGHINEQWPSWWREKFAQRGYTAFDLVRPKHWNDDAIHYWYRQNSFVYVAEGNARAMATARELQARWGDATILFDAVHPAKFTQVASYESISGRRLVRKLPAWLASRVTSRVTRAR